MTSITSSFVLIVSVLSVQYFCVQSFQEKCFNIFHQMMKLTHELLDAGDVPKCVYQYELDKYKSSGLSEDEQAKSMKALKELLKSKTAEEKQGIKNCFDEVRENTLKVYEAKNEPVEEECVKMIIGIQQKMYIEMGLKKKTDKEL